ncbi:MAG: prepilin-type N-terminal cleavage/methylation domain-containing protein [Magnetococcales bacterium]|nr:prepilin-type N-terminal cleavage/methylation domain-containing protein [Magnetococcales bacterium]
MTTKSSSGFSLLELIIVIVVVGISVVILLPVFSRVITSSHRVSELHQGQLLAQERMGQMLQTRWADDGFNNIVDDNESIDLGGPVLFDRELSVQGGVFNSGNGSLSCSGSAYNSEAYKCVIIKVGIAGEGSPLVKRWTMISREGSP